MCIAAGDQTGSSIVSDGSGGAIIAWTDGRWTNTAIFAQRLDAAGFAKWDSNGILVCNQTGFQEAVQLVADGRGGAIAVWRVCQQGDTALFCQRLNHQGIPQWDQSGVRIAPIGLGDSIQAISDSHHGIIVAWDATRGSSVDIFAQRISPNGVLEWTEGGVIVCGDSGNQSGPVITGTNDGGIICT